MRRLIGVVLGLVLTVGGLPRQAAAGVIYESALPGPMDWPQAGAWLSPLEFEGVAFHLDRGALVTAVGGELSRYVGGVTPGEGALFAVIVRLSGPSALPSGNPFNAGTTVAATTFDFVSPLDSYIGMYPVPVDLRIPLSVGLEPGDYGLVFGAGRFGSPFTAQGTIALTAVPIAGVSPFYFGWNSNDGVTGYWHSVGGAPMAMRFVVEGEVVPEPACIVLAAIGLAVMAAGRRRVRGGP